MLAPEELLTGARWKVLENVAEKGPKTATKIAQETGITLPAISQAMKLLEAYGYIIAKKQKRSGPGKPTVEYQLKKQTAMISLCLTGLAEKISITPDAKTEAQLRTFMLSPKDRYWLNKLLCTQDGLLDDCQAIGFVHSTDKESHLVVIAEKLEAFRKEHANIKLEGKTSDDEKGKEKRTIVIWSHTQQEVIEGLERKEAYFIDLIKEAFAFHDPGQLLAALKHKLKEVSA